MDWDQFRNASNLDLVKLNRIRDSIYTTMMRTCNLSFNNVRYSPHASSNVNYWSGSFFFVADVKYGLYEINKKTPEQMLDGPSLVQKMFQWTCTNTSVNCSPLPSAHCTEHYDAILLRNNTNYQ